MATRMPRQAAISPFSIEPRLKEAIRTSAMTMSAKVSHGPNISPILARGGDSSTSATQENAPPTSEAATPRPTARPGLPCLASG